MTKIGQENPEYLIAKSDGIKEYVKELKKKIKAEQEMLEREEQDARHFGMYEDCGQFYLDEVKKRKGRIEVLIEEKISMEKYAKKLKHMAREKKEKSKYRAF